MRHDNVLEVRRPFDASLGLDDQFASVCLDATAWILDILLFDRLHHVRSCQGITAQIVHAQPDADFAVAASHDFHGTDTVHAFNLGFDHIVRVLCQLADRIRPRQRNRHDRGRIGVELLDDRGVDPLRQVSPDRRDFIPHILGGNVDVPPQFKLNKRHRQASHALAAQRLDAADRIDRLLDRLGDIRFDGFRIGTFIEHRDRNDRKIDAGKQVHADSAVRHEAEHDHCGDDHRRKDGLPD